MVESLFPQCTIHLLCVTHVQNSVHVRGKGKHVVFGRILKEVSFHVVKLQMKEYYFQLSPVPDCLWKKHDSVNLRYDHFLTIGKCNNEVAFMGIVGKTGPTTSPTIDMRALFEP